MYTIKCHVGEGGCLPTYATTGSAGVDLSCVSSVKIEPGKVAVVPTGLRMICPEGLEVQIRPRSGLAARHGVTVLNSPGTIDSDFRGEIQVILINHGDKTFTVPRATRIAQAVFARYERVQTVPCSVAEIEQAKTARGGGGFGSTGDCGLASKSDC